MGIKSVDDEDIDIAMKFDFEDIEQVYNSIYMDNGSFSSDSEDQIGDSCEKLIEIFGEYKFELQQFATNVKDLQCELDAKQESVTPSTVKVLGMYWNRETDTLSPYKINLDEKYSHNFISLHTFPIK